MSTRVSPLRSLSTSAADTGTVDPSSVFACDPWTSSHEFSLGPQQQSAGKPKRLHVDFRRHDEPETPMRKVRGQSISADGHSGLVTPQSASRSFSTSSLPMHFTPMHQPLPSPLDTPLTTPLKNPMDNPFDFLGDAKLGAEWNFDFDFRSNSPPPTLQASDLDDYQPSIMRTGSTSTYGSPSDEDGSIVSRSMSTVSMNSMKTGGVNPFYCPPSFLRADSLPGDGSVPNSMPNSAMGSAMGSANKSITPGDLASGVEHAVQGDDAGVSPRGTDEGLLNAEQAPFTDSLCIPESTDFDLMAFHTRDGDSQGLAELVNSSKAASVRTRSSSTTSWGSSAGLDTADKPFFCESCSKRFRRMEHLRRHMKTHTRERPFACTVENCGRRFSRTDNLKAHILTHTKKSGRNIYVEGLAETQQIKPIKRRKPRKPETELNIPGHLTI